MLSHAYKQREMRQIFEEIIKGVNLMTPEIIDFTETDGGIAELSTGLDFDHKPIYGVTVIEDKRQMRGLSRVFSVLKDARAYIEELI